MVLHDHMESLLYIRNQDVSVLHVNTELSFDGFVHLDRGLNVNVSSFIFPVSHEANGDALI